MLGKIAIALRPVLAGRRACDNHGRRTIMPDERRALELIATESTGCPEHLLVACGFSVEFLAGLVRGGLADVMAERVNSDRGTDTAFRLWTTERGWLALAGGN
jgi:hypothetical protein